MMFSQLNSHKIFKSLAKALICGFAGRTYHIVGNLMSRLIYKPAGHITFFQNSMLSFANGVDSDQLFY